MAPASQAFLLGERPPSRVIRPACCDISIARHATHSALRSNAAFPEPPRLQGATMIARCLSRVLAACIAAAGATAFFGIPATAQDVIKVGAPLPLTGPL